MKPSLWSMLCALVMMGSGVARASEIEFFLSRELKPDPAAMQPIHGKANPGDALYFVYRSNVAEAPLGRLARTSKSGEKNIWVCVNTQWMDDDCVPVFKGGMTEAQAKLHAFVFTLIPATNDLDTDHLEHIERLLRYGLHLSSEGIVKVDAYVTSPNDTKLEVWTEVEQHGAHSRWADYLELIGSEQMRMKWNKELAEAGNRPLPTSQLRDPKLEHAILQEAHRSFGNRYRVYKVATAAPSWMYFHDAWGVTTSRGIYLAIMMKDTSTGQCMIEKGYYANQDRHGGAFGDLHLVEKNAGQDRSAVKCEKFVGMK